MAKKKTIIRDSFEQVAELGKSAVKNTAKTVRDIALDTGTAKSLEKLVNGQNHTPLDMNNLNQKYQEQDKQKEAALKVRLFQLSKQEEAQLGVSRKQKEEQKNQAELSEEEGKKKKEKEQKEHQELGNLPEGKKRRSIFSPKKKAREQHAETRPATGKQ